MVWRILTAAMLVAATTAAHAERVLVLESHIGGRPQNAPRIVATVVAELQRLGLGVEERRADIDIDTNLSRPTVVLDAYDLDRLQKRADEGYTQYAAGGFAQAIQNLERTVAEIHATPSTSAQHVELRETLFQSLLGLAMAHAKQGSREEAERTMAELVRSFPDRSVERGRHGPDAAKLYDDVKKKVGALAPATVRVVPSDPKLTIFVNDRYAGAGGFSSSTIIPGPYRVYAQLGNDTGRIHLVTVEPGEKQTIDIDWGFDSTFRSADWRGFVFRSRSERTARETEYARRVLEATGADSVIILSFGDNGGRPALYASLWSGTPLATTRAGLVILQGKDSDLECTAPA